MLISTFLLLISVCYQFKK